MQNYVRITYPRSVSETKEIILRLDEAWTSTVTGPRGLRRSKNFLKIIKISEYILRVSKEKSISEPAKSSFHIFVNQTIKDWAKKRHLPVSDMWDC